jgi:hypothetical protein
MQIYREKHRQRRRITRIAEAPGSVSELRIGPTEMSATIACTDDGYRYCVRLTIDELRALVKQFDEAAADYDARRSKRSTTRLFLT